jgi:hypothetical protein
MGRNALPSFLQFVSFSRKAFFVSGGRGGFHASLTLTCLRFSGCADNLLK